MSQRIMQLDYLKGVMIVLVVVFHIVAFDATYPTLRTVVYTFHVSVFLLISGYLSNIDKKPTAFRSKMLKLIVPYIIFETLYMFVLYGIGQAFDSSLAMRSLAIQDVVIRLLAYPLGVYWYFHALIVCNVVYYLIFHYLRLSVTSKFVLMSVVLYGITFVIKEVGWATILAGGGFVWESIMYFLIGVFINLVGVPFLKMIPASVLSVIPFGILVFSLDNYYRGSLSGIALTLLVISFLLFVFNHISSSVRKFWCYLGRNSLVIFVFSPFIIPVTKYVLPLFNFDKTVVLFTIFTVSITIICCFSCALLSDKLRLSKYLFGKERIYSPLYERT